MQGVSRRQGHPLAKRRNAADALSHTNPTRRADSGAPSFAGATLREPSESAPSPT